MLIIIIIIIPEYFIRLGWLFFFFLLLLVSFILFLFWKNVRRRPFVLRVSVTARRYPADGVATQIKTEAEPSAGHRRGAKSETPRRTLYYSLRPLPGHVHAFVNPEFRNLCLFLLCAARIYEMIRCGTPLRQYTYIRTHGQNDVPTESQT